LNQFNFNWINIKWFKICWNFSFKNWIWVKWEEWEEWPQVFNTFRFVTCFVQSCRSDVITIRNMDWHVSHGLANGQWPSAVDPCCHVVAARSTNRWKDRLKSINHGPNRQWEGSHRCALHFRHNYWLLMTPISPSGRQRQNFGGWTKSGGNPPKLKLNGLNWKFKLNTATDKGGHQRL